MNLFNTLPTFLQEALSRQLIKEPTPIQARSLPASLAGKDVLGTAQTGTGKTLAFLLPLVVRLTNCESENALILSPTRELAQQIVGELEKLTNLLPAALIIGGDNIHKQYALLRRKPRVIVATPGRLLDHIGRKSVNLSATHFVVLDETDRMLDMGFREDMQRILSVLPTPRQTLLFSATLPTEIVKLADELLTRPLRVQIGEITSPAQGVFQEIVYVSVREKLPQLLHELNTRKGSVLVFVKTKRGAERLAKELKRYGQKVNALHGELRQNRRKQIMDFFRSGVVRVLVATDLAARGLDVAHIAHVINYDLPQCPEDYIHRIGRTGRAGSVGNAISFISDDGASWREICRVTRFPTGVKTVEKTVDPLPQPKFIAHEESDVHAKRKRQKESALTRTSTQDKLADNLYGKKLPAASKPAMRSVKKPKTFTKTTQAARLLDAQLAQETSRQTGTISVVKVGMSKRALRQLQKGENTRPISKKSFSPRFKKRFKHNKRK